MAQIDALEEHFDLRIVLYYRKMLLDLVH